MPGTTCKKKMQRYTKKKKMSGLQELNLRLEGQDRQAEVEGEKALTGQESASEGDLNSMVLATMSATGFSTSFRALQTENQL
jgi:hypothetical protein